MASDVQVAALIAEFSSAKTSGHIWPEFAACEAMLESRWGTTECYTKANNPFGQKQRAVLPNGPGVEYASLLLPTWEVVNGHTEHITAAFVVFPDRATAYVERMKTLRRLAGTYPEYAAALSASSGEEFVIEVSRRWSTDPQRARTVLEIHAAHLDAFR